MKYYIKLEDRGRHGDITQKLQNILNETKNTEEEKIISFERGTYHFFADFCQEEELYASNTDSGQYPYKKSAINIDGIRNLTIEGNGSEFIMHGKMIAVKVSFSENITLKNFSWDFPCAGTLEMKLIKKTLFYADYQLPDSCQWEIKGVNFHWFEKSIFDGKDYWRNIGQKESYCIVVNDERTGNLSRYPVTEGPFSLAYKIRKIAENKVRIYSLKPVSDKFKCGNIFEICTDKKRDCVGSFFLESKNLTAENIAVRYMHGFSWLTQMCENVLFRDCDFTPIEGSQRKCTSFADLIHVSGAKGKVHIENCRFSNAHDDPVNIHGTFTVIKEKIDNNTLLLEYAHNQQRGFVQYHKGDKVIFYLRENLEGFDNEKVFTVRNVINPLEEGLDAKQMKVTFEEELPQELFERDKYAVENITYTPDVYIGNCIFSSIPTRGILCTTRGEVLIENNTFDGMTMASIYLSNDCNNWFESGAIRNMTIRNNTFYIRKAPVFRGAKPAILIEPIVLDKSRTEKAIHRNITIEGNTFHLEHGNAVDAVFTENLIIRNNKILNLTYNQTTEKLSAFNIRKCRNVIFENNSADENIFLNV